MQRNFRLLQLSRAVKDKGPLYTARRIIEIFANKLFYKRRILYYADLTLLPNTPYILPKSLRIECVSSKKEISASDIEALYSRRQRKIIEYQFSQRFSKGARLWLIKKSGLLVGILWSMTGKTLEPYYFPLTPKDVHLFDNEIFPDYRSKGINPHLINSVLLCLKKEGKARAYIETRINNISEIKSLSKTHFNAYGSAILWNFFKKNITFHSYNYKTSRMHPISAENKAERNISHKHI